MNDMLPTKKPKGTWGPAAQSDPGGEAHDNLITQHIRGLSPPQPDIGTHHVTDQSHLRREGRLAKDATLQDRYCILGVIGAGGMSTVYKAQDMRFPKVTRLCAVKEMLNIATNPQVRQRNLRNFEREAGILATLNYPAIPQVYDYFSEGEHSYLVMEFIQGTDLEALLDSMEGFPTESQVIGWALQICEVLIYLHNHKPHPIVFRDVKPSNIMVDDDGRVRLVDFGIAKVFTGGHKGTMIGTEGYSPPEQYRGMSDPRGDIYSLGATLHHLFSKQDPRLEPPFSFHERSVHTVNPMVSDEMAAIVHRALEYDINERFGSAEEMYQGLLNLKSARGALPSLFTADFDQAGAPTTLWKFTCEDEVRSTPAVANGVLYVGVYDNNLYALEAKSGKFLWKYPTEGGIGSSPCIFQGKVFVGSQDQLLYALNAESGHLLWTCPTGGAVYSSPRAHLGYIFFGSDDHNLYAVKISSGRIAWTFQAEAAIRSSPAIGKDAIYFGDEGGSVYSVDSGGKMLWRFRARRGVTSSPLLAEDTLYVGSKDGYLYALDIQSGWDIWHHRTSGPIISSPVASESAVFFGSTDEEIYAVSVSSGRTIWRYKTNGQVTSSAVLYRGAVYIGSTDGRLYSLDAKTGKLRWRFQTKGPIISSPCLAEDIIYIGSSDHYVYALPA